MNEKMIGVALTVSRESHYLIKNILINKLNTNESVIPRRMHLTVISGMPINSWKPPKIDKLISIDFEIQKTRFMVANKEKVRGSKKRGLAGATPNRKYNSLEYKILLRLQKGGPGYDYIPEINNIYKEYLKFIEPIKNIRYQPHITMLYQGHNWGENVCDDCMKKNIPSCFHNEAEIFRKEIGSQKINFDRLTYFD